MITKEKLINLYYDTANTKKGKTIKLDSTESSGITYIGFLNKSLIGIGIKNNFFFKNIYKSKATLIKKRKIIMEITEEYVKNGKVFPDSILLPLVDSFTEKELNTIEDDYKTLLLFSPQSLDYDILDYCIENFYYSIDDIDRIIASYINYLDWTPHNIEINYKDLMTLLEKYFSKDQQEQFIKSIIIFLKEKIMSKFKLFFAEISQPKGVYNHSFDYLEYLFNFLHYLITLYNKNNANDEEKEFLSLILKPLIYSLNENSSRFSIKLFTQETIINIFGDMKENALSILFGVEGFRKKYIEKRIEWYNDNKRKCNWNTW